MFMPQTLPKQPLLFPIKGLHEGVGYDFQPPGTTPDALNVRGYDALKNRLRGGRRAGISKFFGSQINGNNVIQAVAKTVEGTAYVSQNSDDRPSLLIDDTFSTYTIARPTYLGENWVYKDSPLNIANGGNARQAGDHWGVTANGLLMDGAYTSSATELRYLLLPLRFEGPNKVLAVMRARTKATNASTNTGAADDCQCMGPFIRGNAACQSFVFAALIRNGADNTVRLQIIYHSTTAETVLVQSADITLLNSATILDTLTISLVEDLDTNILTANVAWPAAGAASADINVTVSIQDTTNNIGLRRVGFGVYGRVDLSLAAASAFRTIKRITTRRYVDASTAVASSISTTDASTNQFLVPSGFTSVRIDAAGTGTFFSQPGPYDSNTILHDSLMRLDTTADTFNAYSHNPSAHYGGFFRNTALAADGTRLDPEVGLRAATSTGAGGITFGTRFDASFKNGLFHSILLADANAVYATTGVTHISVISIDKFAANDLSSNLAVTSQRRVPVHRNSTVKVVDDGAVVKFYIDNCLVDFQQSDTSFPGQNYVGIGGFDSSGLALASLIRVFNWRKAAPSTEDLPIGSTSISKLLIISNGTVVGLGDGELLPTTNGTNAMTAERFQIQVQSAYNRTFMVDGTHSKFYNLADNTVSDWVATTGKGTVPDRCRLIALFRGRLVLAGKVDDPHNWFMSALGDAFDWDYSPAITTVTQAVAGNNADAGLVGDIITALIPFTDDVMLFGSDHSIWAMTGDPAAGGTIDLVTDQTGIAFGRAWAKDPDGNLYFWGQDGIYKMVPGMKPVNISKGRIDVRLRAVDLNFNRITMEWDYLRASLKTLIVPGNIANSSRQIVWESRNDAWWEDQYPTSMGPHIMFSYDTSAASDQAFIYGCRDGYLRKVDEDAQGDDGQDITSRFRFEPFIAQDHASEVVLNTILPILAGESGSTGMYLDVYTGQSAEECSTAVTPRVRRLLTHAGRNASVRQKVRGYAVQLGMSQTGQSLWALEGCTVTFEQSGKPRAEVKGVS